MAVFREWLRRVRFRRRMTPYKRSDVVRMFPEFCTTASFGTPGRCEL